MKSQRSSSRSPVLPDLHSPSWLPGSIKRLLMKFYWPIYDTWDFFAEVVGWLPSNRARCFSWRLLGVSIGRYTSIHRNCRFYHPSRVRVGDHCVILRDSLFDGRMGITIGSNVNIAEGVKVFSLQHNVQSSNHDVEGEKVSIGDRVFIGAGATIMPGVTIAEGAVIGAGAVVTQDVLPYTIVAGVPARPIGKRSEALVYELNYRKFLG